MTQQQELCNLLESFGVKPTIKASGTSWYDQNCPLGETIVEVAQGDARLKPELPYIGGYNGVVVTFSFTPTGEFINMGGW